LDCHLFSGDGKTVGWHEALDRAVFQKILPKIHGNRRQLGESLRALGSFLTDEPVSYAIGSKKIEIAPAEGTGLKLTLSSTKVANMLLRLGATGHTTFVI
jgi:hypothetical protein